MTESSDPTIFQDYARAPVPPEKRRGALFLAVVFTACAVSLASMLLGGSLAIGLTLRQAVVAIFLGNLLSAVIACLTSKVAIETHLSAAMICRTTFGRHGAILVVGIYALSAWGWFGVQTGLFGDTLARLVKLVFQLDVSPDVIRLFVLGGGLLMMSTAIFGYRAIEKLSTITLPLMGGLILASLVVVLREHGVGTVLAAPPLGAPIGLGVGISMVAGSFMAAAVGAPGIMRYARNMRDAVIAVFSGFMLGLGGTVLVATMCAKATGESNIVEIMVSLGWGASAMVVLILAQWTTNDNNLYSSGLALSAIIQALPKWKLTLISGGVGIVLAVLGIYESLMFFFLVLSALLPPIGGIYVADYFFNPGVYQGTGSGSRPGTRLRLSAWAPAALLGLSTNPPPSGFGLFEMTRISALDSFLAGVFFYVLLTRFSRSSPSAPPERSSP